MNFNQDKRKVFSRTFNLAQETKLCYLKTAFTLSSMEDISHDMCTAKDEFEITECPRS